MMRLTKKQGYLALLIILCSLPALILGFNLFTDGLGANPVESLEHTTGDWALYFLLMTLASPLISRWIKTRLSRTLSLPLYLIQRTLGLSAFIYATLHLLIYFGFDLELNLSALWDDLIERPFIFVGMLAWLLLLPLALTSTLKWQKRLKKHWKTLHRLIYPATGLGILHFFWLVKADLFQPFLIAILFILIFSVKIRYHN